MLSRGRKVTVARYYLSVPMEFIKIADARWQNSVQAGQSFSHCGPGGRKRLKRCVSFVSDRHRPGPSLISRKPFYEKSHKLLVFRLVSKVYLGHIRLPVFTNAGWEQLCEKK